MPHRSTRYPAVRQKWSLIVFALTFVIMIVSFIPCLGHAADDADDERHQEEPSGGLVEVPAAHRFWAAWPTS